MVKAQEIGLASRPRPNPTDGPICVIDKIAVHQAVLVSARPLHKCLESLVNEIGWMPFLIRFHVCHA
jgi:hypothetical protein